MSITLSQLNTDEVLRYMGTPPERADESLRAVVEQCAARMLEAIEPRWAWRAYSLSFLPEGVQPEGGPLLPGQSLKEHLTGCDRAVVFCVTLGARADALIRQGQCTDVLQALALDCCASAAVEQVCDRVEEELYEQFPGGSFPYRFSPGYGDLPLRVQGELLDALDAHRRVGLSATGSHILTPRKSVTAILGVADHPIEQHKRSCVGCLARRNCQYRKSGGHCGIL